MTAGTQAPYNALVVRASERAIPGAVRRQTVFSSCGWCGEHAASGSHAECSEALRVAADQRFQAARAAAGLAESLLEEAAMLNVAADMIEPEVPLQHSA